jgi:hypothetical protein
VQSAFDIPAQRAQNERVAFQLFLVIALSSAVATGTSPGRAAS